MKSRNRTESQSTASSVEALPFPPGPDGHPFIGNLPSLIRDPWTFYETLEEYGDIVRFEAGRNRFTTLLHPTYIEDVLVRNPDRFKRWSFSDVGLSFAPEGLLVTEGEQWRRQRQVMQPAFTVERIGSYAETMATLTEETIDTWEDGEEVDLNVAFSKLTLEILSDALFGLDVDPEAEDEAITRAARLLNEQAGPGRNLTMFLPDWVPTPTNRRYRRAMDAYEERLDELIARRVDTPEAERPADLLTILLHEEGPGGESLSEAEVRDNLLTFMFAGHETTSLGLAYTCLLLAQHDQVAEKLQNELATVLEGQTPRLDHVAELTYAEQVVKEAMRLYPPAFIMFREVIEDAVIGDYHVPEGTILTLPQFRLHTDGRFWDAPQEFLPARWETEDPDRPEYAYFPFGGGPRHCIGMRFAMLEMKLVLATLAQQVDMTLLSDPDPDPIPGVTLQPEENVRVRVSRMH